MAGGGLKRGAWGPPLLDTEAGPTRVGGWRGEGVPPGCMGGSAGGWCGFSTMDSGTEGRRGHLEPRSCTLGGVLGGAADKPGG